jgi:hypothetical protein
MWLSAFFASLFMGLILESRGNRAEFREDKYDTREDYLFFMYNLLMWLGVLLFLYLLAFAICYTTSTETSVVGVAGRMARMLLDFANVPSVQQAVVLFLGYCLALFVLAMYIIESKHADSYVFDFHGDQKVREDSEDEIKKRHYTFLFTMRMVQCVNWVHLMALPLLGLALYLSPARAPPSTSALPAGPAAS